MTFKSWIASLAVADVFGSTTQAKAMYLIVDLGTLGRAISGAEGINNRGQVIGSASLVEVSR